MVKSFRIYEAPDNTLDSLTYPRRIFLAGTIEMGKSVDWQQDAISKIEKQHYRSSFLSTCVYNPRRKKWDPTWKQSIDNLEFSQQVNWEFNCLDKATSIIMYLDGASRSPISLLELGLYARSGKLHVVCHKDFYRLGNVEIVCNNFKIPMYESLEEVINIILP